MKLLLRGTHYIQTLAASVFEKIVSMIKPIIFLLLFTAFAGPKRVETVKIKGILTTENGDAIPGCNVIIKGRTLNVNTGICGEFEIDVTDGYDEVLVFACMTYRVWEVRTDSFKGKDVTIICLKDWREFENGTCERNYKKEKRIKIR